MFGCRFVRKRIREGEERGWRGISEGDGWGLGKDWRGGAKGGGCWEEFGRGDA